MKEPSAISQPNMIKHVGKRCPLVEISLFKKKTFDTISVKLTQCSLAADCLAGKGSLPEISQ